MIHDMRVLVLTGPPAVGKTTVGRLVAAARPRCAMVDIDDVRHLIVSGHAAPWDGADGRAQQDLGVRNGCALAANFAAHGVDAVLVDVLDDATAARYRELLGDPLIVQLTVDYQESLRRAHTRTVHLSWEEFRQLHDQQQHFAGADCRIDTTGLSAEETAARLVELWTGS